MEHIFAFGGRYKMATSPDIRSDSASFALPSNLPKVFHDSARVKATWGSVATEEDCYQAQMISYTMNPYVYGHSGDKHKVRLFLCHLQHF